MKNAAVVYRSLVVTLASLLLLVGCQSKPTVATPVSPATGADDWARIQASGKLVVGTSAGYPPFSFYTDNFTLDGFDVVLAREMGQRLGLEVEIRDFAFEGLLNALQLGQIDMAIAALSVTTAREKVADFTRIYYVGEDAFLARVDAAISAIRQTPDLVNYRIGVQTGSVYATWLRNNLVDLLPSCASIAAEHCWSIMSASALIPIVPTLAGPVTYQLEASNDRTARYRDVTVTVLVRQPR